MCCAAATALPALDAVVFTGGIGEHAAEIRAEICRRLASVGLPAGLTAQPESDAVLGPAHASVQVLCVRAREDLVIARGVARLLG